MHIKYKKFLEYNKNFSSFKDFLLLKFKNWDLNDEDIDRLKSGSNIFFKNGTYELCMERVNYIYNVLDSIDVEYFKGIFHLENISNFECLPSILFNEKTRIEFHKLQNELVEKNLIIVVMLLFASKNEEVVKLIDISKFIKTQFFPSIYLEYKGIFNLLEIENKLDNCISKLNNIQKVVWDMNRFNRKFGNDREIDEYILFLILK